MFEFMYDISGFNHALTADMPIEVTTNIKKGQIVKIVSGKVVNKSSGPYLGIANETHTGECDPFNPRSNGDLINVIISPGAVYSTEPPIFDFSVNSPNETTATSPATGSYSADDFVGGHIVLLSKGAESANTDTIGTVREITAYNDGTLTITSGGKICKDDKYAYLPPIGFKKMEMDSSTCSQVVLTDTTSEFTVAGYDFEQAKIYVICRNNLIS